MKRRLLRGMIWLLLSLAAVSLAGCSQFYTPDEIEALLAERYGLTFTVGSCRSEEAGKRIYPVSCAEFPELAFEAADICSPAGWSAGGDGVPPLPHGSTHLLLDSFRTVSWNRYAPPLLALYGVEGLEVPEEQRFYGVDYYNDAVCEYSILLADDPDGYTDALFELLACLDSLPAFRTYQGDGGSEGFSAYGVPVRLSVADGIGNTVEHLRLAVGHGYEREELAEQLAVLRRTVRNNLKREMERSGVLASVVGRAEFPAIGDDFLFLTDADDGAFLRTCAEVSLSGGWAALAALVWEGRGCLPDTLCVYPAASFGGRVWYCAAEPSSEAYRFCIDPETGEVWQYAPCRGNAFLVDTGVRLPAETLAAAARLSAEAAEG